MVHVNVEVVASIAAIKYMYKFVYKEPDRTMAKLAAIPILANAEFSRLTVRGGTGS